MTRNYKTATVFGGTGFIGRQVVRELAKKGYRVKVATRVPERAYFLKPCGTVGQVVPFPYNAGDVASITKAVEGSEAVVNCIGILREKKKGDFKRVHTDFPEALGKICSKVGVKSFVHISALGVDEANSNYAISKAAGEKAVKKAFKNVVILRPSVVFGEGDNFFNMFAEMARYVPVLPLIGGGKTKFQPVYVGDVADAVIASIGNFRAKGEIFELGGPEVLSFKQIFERMFEYTGRSRALMNMPFCVAKMKAFFMGVLPNPPLTPDQVESLKTDNIVSDDALKLENLGVQETALDMILPKYMQTYLPGGRFAALRLSRGTSHPAV